MKRFTATLYRSCNVLVIVVLLLGLLPSAQNMSSPTFEPPVAHAQEGATIPLEEGLGTPDEADPSPDGASGQLQAPETAEPEGVSPGDLSAYTVALTNTTGAVGVPAPSADGASGGLLATKMAEPAVVSPGDLITYTIVLTNTTRAAMEGLVVSDPLPDGLAYLPGSAEGGEYDPRTKTLTWEVQDLAAGASLSVTFQARVRGDVLDDLVVNLAEVTGGGLADPVQAQATVAVVSQAVITPQEGGVLVSPSGRVRVEFPAGAVAQPVEATYRALDVRRLPPGQTGLALQCELTARPANAEASDLPITQFQEPLQLTVDMTGLVDVEAMGQYKRLFVGYLDEATGRWVHLPLVEQQADAVLTVEVEHFSILGGGLDGSTGNGGWLLLYNEPQVALFSGGAVYNHSIEVPPGRNGLQPALNLSYNSRRVDGIMAWAESDWAGMGWSMDLMDIVREGLKCVMHDQTMFIHYENRFSLLMNGTSYELEPDPGVGAGQPGRYHAKDAPYLYLELKIGGDNKIGWYWHVYTPDGTRYQLGYSTNSEQVLYLTPNGEGWYNGGVKDSGPEKNYTTFRWRLDEATDVYSNTMQATYREAQGGQDDKRDTASVLHEVEYNSTGVEQWAAKVVFNPGGSNFGPQPDYDDRRIFGSQGQLDRIEVRHGGELVRVRYYDLEYDNTTTPANTTIRRLISIQQFSGDGQQSLPATTLDYEDKWNKDKCNPADPECDTDWELESFPYPRLVEVENGYGGKTGFNYVDDGRGGWWGAFYNYRVSGRHIYDGLDTDPARVITYTYGKMCYDQTSNNSDDYPPGMMAKCTGRSAPYVGPLVGHAWVTETLYSDDTPLVETAHHFYTDTNHSWRLGREYETQVYSGQGALLGETDTTWDSMTISNTTFAHVDQAVMTDYSGGATVSTRVDYDYDGYGNTTEVGEYYNGSGALYRRTVKQYVYNPDTTVWIVNRVSRQQLFDSGDVEKSRTDYYYDRDAQGNLRAHGSTPTKGALVAVKAVGLGTTADSLTQFWYDSYGNQTKTRDPNGYDTETTYDATLHTLPIEQANAASHVTEWYYYGVNGTTPVPAGGFFGKLERVRDPNNTDTWYRYDAFGRLTKVIRPGDDDAHPTLVYAYYDDNLEPVAPFMLGTWRKHDPSATPWSTGGTWSREFFDGLGRLIQVQTPHQDWGGSGVGHEIVRFATYDHQGLKASESVGYEKDAYVYDPNCNGTGRTCNPYVDPDLNQPQAHYSYDALGRVLIQTNPDDTQIEHHYGVADGMAYDDVIDPNRHRVQYRYDVFGRLGRVYEISGDCGNYWGYNCGGQYNTPWAVYATTDYAYNVLDNLTGVTDAAGNSTTMTYDALSRKTSMTDPDMGAWSYDYDAAGNLTSQTDAENQTIAFTYDALNRLTFKDLPTGTDVQYYYDEVGYGKSKGKRTQMTDGSGSTKYYYNDARGRLMKEEKVISGEGTFVTQWSYYADDQVWTMTYPGGEVVTTTYNPMGLLKSVVGDNTYVGDTTYNALGQVDLRKLGSDVLRTDYVYFGVSGNFRLQQLKTGTPSSPTSLQDLRYTYDNVGNVTNIKDYKAGSPQTQSFSYDHLDRVVTAQASGGSGGTYGPDSYTYNAIGNLLSKTGVGSYLYDAPVSGCSAGTPATKPHAARQAGSYTFTYDCNGNMVQRNVGTSYTLTYDAQNQLTGVSGGASASFVYDGDGNRVKATFGTETTVYIGDYYEQTGTASTKYYYAGSQRVALRRSGYASDNGLFWLLTDHLGSTAITAYSSGGKKAELRYKVWGETRYTDGTTPTTYRFTGQRLDESTGLMYYGARYYDPALGRFVQADTIVPEPGNPQALNRYSYVYNNPLRYIDPTGHEALLHRIRRRFHWATAPWQPWYNLPLTVCGSVGCVSGSMRDINNSGGDKAIYGLDADIQRAAQDAGVPTILLAAALHHQGASPRLMDLGADLTGYKSPGNVSRGIGQITIDEAMKYNRLGLVLDPVPDEALADALYIPEVSVRYMAAKLKESSLLIDELLRKPEYSTISLSEGNRWLLLMAAQNAGPGAVDYFFEHCGGGWQCWFNKSSLYAQVLYMRDDIAWMEEHGWIE